LAKLTSQLIRNVSEENLAQKEFVAKKSDEKMLLEKPGQKIMVFNQ
jgi:hypothetical protein